MHAVGVIQVRVASEKIAFHVNINIIQMRYNNVKGLSESVHAATWNI